MYLAAACAIGSAVSSIFGGISSRKKEKEAARLQRYLNAGIASQYNKQSGMYLNAANVAMGGGEKFVKSADLALEIGKYNARDIITAAAQVQNTQDHEIRRINNERRQKIGEGRATFAANGILVDSGTAAMWEQDEVADAAIEKMNVFKTCSDEITEYTQQAKQAIMAGYGNKANILGQAGSLFAQAASLAMSGYGSAMNASASLWGGNTSYQSGTSLALQSAGTIFSTGAQIFGNYNV